MTRLFRNKSAGHLFLCLTFLLVTAVTGCGSRQQRDLPEGVTEGTWLTVEFKIDKKTTADQYRKNRELIEKIKEKGKGKGKEF